MEYTTDPDHWSNRFPWNRKGTKVREALELFLTVMARAPGADQQGRKDALTWARAQLDKKPPELFP